MRHGSSYTQTRLSGDLSPHLHALPRARHGPALWGGRPTGANAGPPCPPHVTLRTPPSPGRLRAEAGRWAAAEEGPSWHWRRAANKPQGSLAGSDSGAQAWGGGGDTLVLPEFGPRNCYASHVCEGSRPSLGKDWFPENNPNARGPKPPGLCLGAKRVPEPETTCWDHAACDRVAAFSVLEIAVHGPERDLDVSLTLQLCPVLPREASSPERG